MDSIEDMAEYLELHPHDHDLRWRLAKKLYKASEYALALEHLQVLKEQWTLKLNVVRYLSATYYRLERYDKAITELEWAIEEWPDEVPLRIQLAHVLSIAGRDEQVKTVHHEIRQLKSRQRTAKTRHKKDESKQSIPLDDSAFGVALIDGPVCPSCGALNSEEFERCWKCHVPLGTASAKPAQATPVPVVHAGPPDLDAIWHVAGSIAIAVFLALGVLLTVRQFMAAGQASDGLVIRTVQDVFNLLLLPSHVIVGVTLIVVWPLALWVAVALVEPEDIPLKSVAVTGLLFASIAYCVLWAPIWLAPYVLLALLAASLIPILATLGVDYGRGVLIWAIQGALVAAAAVSSFGAVEGGGALMQFPAVVRYATAHDREPGAGRYTFPGLRVRADAPLRWQSTGSAWLDEKACNAAFEMMYWNADADLIVEFKDNVGTRFYNHVSGAPFKFRYRVAPEVPYQLIVTGREGTEVNLTVYGVLKAVLQ